MLKLNAAYPMLNLGYLKFTGRTKNARLVNVFIDKDLHAFDSLLGLDCQRFSET